MKKESTGKKSLLWLWITIGVVVLLAAAGVASYFLFFSGNGDEKAPTQNNATVEKKVESDLYWNIDRKDMLEISSGLSMREPAEDGIYYIRFAVGGEVVELPCADKKLVNRIDMEDLVCLEFDADGLIINMVDPEEVYTKIAEKVYVQNISGNKLLVNTSQALNGMQINLEVPAAEGFDVSHLAGTPGEVRVLEGMDQITVYGTDENTPTHIFVVDRWWESDVYWRVSAQMYSKGMSTRQQAEDGYWYMDWTVNGETVTLRTNRNDVINAWDGYNVTKACCGMVFDENGDVIDCFSAAWAVRGVHKCEQWDVVELSEDGKTFTVERILFGNDVGKTFTGTIGEDCGVFNVNSTADVFGEPTELKLNDRLQVYCDPMGNPKVIFVMNRMVDSPMYYNISSQWSSGLGRTQRTPDADGWYNILLAVDGKQVTYRTKDFEIANRVDASNGFMGLKVQNGIILKVYEPVTVAGNYSWVTGYFVTDIQGPVLTATSTGGTAKSGVMTPDCGVYDVSGQGKFKGVATTLRMGDRISCYQNALGEVTYIYVTDRYQAGSQMYWNVARKSLKNDQTTRTPDADGWYVFDVIKLGSTDVTQIKTKDVKVATEIDRQSSPTLFAAHVNKDGVVTGAYPPQAAIATGGYRTLPGVHIERQISEEENTWHCVVRSTGATGTLKMNDEAKVYNFSGVYASKKGERTTIQLQDRIYCYGNNEGKIQVIIVIEREAANSKVYYKKSVSLTPDEDGYYKMVLTCNGKAKEYKTKDLEVATFVSKQNIAFGGYEKDGVLTAAFSASSTPAIHASGAGSYYDVVSVSGGKLQLKRNRPGQTDTGKEATLELASGYKVYNVSGNKTVEDGWGKADKLQAGDRIHAYVNKDGKAVIIYIVWENTRNDNGFAECPHCGETVWWERFDSGTTAVACDGHYYVAQSFSTNNGFGFGKAPAAGEESDYHFVLDMNGKTITRHATVSQAKDPDGNPMVDELTGEPVMNRAGSTGVFYANYGHLIVDDFSKNKTGKLVSDPEGITFSGSYVAFGVGANAEMTIENINVDYSTAKSSYSKTNGGLIAVGGKLTVNGGTFIGLEEGMGSGGAIIGTWGGSELIINGGTFVGTKNTASGTVLATNGKLVINGGDFSGGTAKNGGILYASGAANEVYIKGGKFHDAKSTNGGGFIWSGAKTYITGGEFVGVGNNPELMSRSGGILYCQGMELFIDNVTIKNGYGNGYGMNIYYVNNNGGTFTIGKNAKIYGNTVIRCAGRKVGEEIVVEPVNLIVQEGALVDHTGSEVTGSNNLRVQNVDFYINEKAGEPIKLKVVLDGAESNANYSLAYTCKGKLVGVVDGTTNEAVHTFGDDRICDDCGYDLDAFVDWTDANKLPTKAGNYKLMTDVTVTSEYGNIDAIIDLNGHNITRVVEAGGKSGGVWSTGSNHTLTIIDSTAGNPGTIKTIYAEGTTHTSSGGVVFTVNEKSTLTIKAGIIDGSAVDVTYKATNMGTIVSGGTLILEGERTELKGVKSAAGNGGAIGGWSNTGSTITIKDGAKVYGSQGTAGSGAVLATTGEGVFLDGAYIYEGKAAGNGNGILISAGKTVFTVKDSVIDGGLQITGCASATFTGDVVINKGAAYGLKSAKAIDMNGLTDGSQIYVENLGTLSTAFTDATAAQALIDAECFINDNVNYKFKVVGSAIAMVDETPAPEAPEFDADKIVWTDITDTIPTTGSVRLTQDITLANRVVLTGDLHIDLNGFNITYALPATATSGQAIYAGEDYTLYVTDNSGKATVGTIKMTHADGQSFTGVTGVIYASSGATFVLDNGIIDGSAIKSNFVDVKTGAVTLGNSTTTNRYATLVMNGGMIIGQRNNNGSSGYGGSAIGAMGKTNVYINGGIVKGGASDGGTDYVCKTGGAINAGGNVTITGGEIIGTRVANHGGSIWVEGAESKLTMTGGIVRGGYAGVNGGNIIVNGAIAEITGGRIIDGDNNGVWGYNLDFTTGSNTGWNIIGGDVIIEGGVSIRSGNVVVRDKAIVDGMLDSYKNYSFKIEGGDKLYVGDDLTTPAFTATSTAKVALTYDATGKVSGVVGGGAAKDWTDATSLPTTGWYTLQTDVTVSGITYFGKNLGIDLNGHTITRVMPAGSTGNTTIFSATCDKDNTAKQGYYLTLVDHSGSKGSVKVVYEDANDKRTGTIYSGVLYANTGAGINLKNVVIDGSAINSTSTNSSGTILIGNDSKLYINNSHIKGYGSTASNGSAIASWQRNVVVIDGDQTIIEGSVAEDKHGGIIQNNAVYLEINGGTFRAYEGTTNVGASGGLMFVSPSNVGTEIVINGGTFYGTKVSGAGSILNADKVQKVTINGGTFYGAAANTGSVLYTGGELTINGGDFHGVGTQYKTPVKDTHSHGGILTAYGEKVTINGGVFDGGAPTGYGPNIYFDRTAAGGGELYIGEDAVIHGGLTIRGKADTTNVKVTIADGAVIDKELTTTTHKPGYNLRVNFVELWIDGADAANETWSGTDADDQKNFNLVYTEGVLTDIAGA